MKIGGLDWCAWSFLVNSWPAWLMLGTESHSRDLGMNSHSFLFEDTQLLSLDKLVIELENIKKF